MQRVQARELKQHTGAIIDRVRRGERFLLTHRGTPIAVIMPMNRAAVDTLLDPETAHAALLGLLRPCESALAFWDNPEDDVWDRVEPTPIR